MKRTAVMAARSKKPQLHLYLTLLLLREDCYNRDVTMEEDETKYFIYRAMHNV